MEDNNGSQPDQALIIEWILTQLDAIGKRLTAIEQNSASAARPKAKKLASASGTASSSLNRSSHKTGALSHDRSMQDQAEARIKEVSDIDAKGTDLKYKSQGGVVLLIFMLKKSETDPKICF